MGASCGVRARGSLRSRCPGEAESRLLKPLRVACAMDKQSGDSAILYDGVTGLDLGIMTSCVFFFCRCGLQT